MKSKRAREAATAAEDFLPVEDAPVEKKRKRSDDEPADDVKQKKAKKDKKDKKDKKKDKKESRREKKDKRKDLQDLPEEDGGDEVATPAVEVSEKTEEPKKEKKSKKEKSKEQTNGDVDPKKEKKEKKKKSKDKTETPANEADAENANADGKASRYIVFVGNLPFTATAESIKAHFASLKPISVRCMKNKDDDKPCRGIAFVEFGNVWTMRTCLDKFHHTEFEGRKINVELTAGGGGKTKFRRDKILEKNKKLDENRTKRIEKERVAKLEGSGAKEDASGIHPSRLARVQGLGY